MNFESRGEYPEEFDKFSGKDLDEEFDREEESDIISSEDMAVYLKNTVSGLYSKMPAEFQETFEDIIGNIELYYSAKDKDWKKKVIEPLENIIDEISGDDRSEIEEKEDEFGDRLVEIQRESIALKKNKVH